MKLSTVKWENQKLGALCDLITDGTHFTPKYVEAGIPFLSVKNLTSGIIDFSDTKFVTEEEHKILSKRCCPKINDLLYTKVGTTGVAKVIDTEREFSIFVSVALLKPKVKEIYNYYLEQYLNSSFGREQANALTKGTANRNLVIRDIAEINIKYPKSLDEQKQIAALFQSIEASMEQVDGQENNLYQLKHKLLKDLFSEKQEFGNHLKAKDFETVKFEKIALNISERVEPKKTELTTYVGLEHLDADNLKIERTGTPDDVIGTKLKIYKGDIIFGKRRAYLRKIAVSHFDGIASAHSMILRANEKNIEKDFLPYFMQSDTFMSRAVQISEGSLSPTIKNSTLAKQEFILPKKEKQKELTEVFKQFDTTIEQLKQQKTTLKHLKQKLLNEILG